MSGSGPFSKRGIPQTSLVTSVIASNPSTADQGRGAGAEGSLQSSTRWPRTVGRAAFALAVIATALSAIDLATRPPCPERYVRLVDFEVALPFVTAVLAIGGFAVYRISRRPGTHRVAGAVGGALLALALVANVAVGLLIAWHHSPGWTYTHECWTF